jgi:hypothetical protein
MLLRQMLRWAGVLSAMVVALTASASAQGVTGTVTGTVKDAQGGVIPGATVTLISDTRGTSSAPVVSGTSGDFVFPNVTADTYTVQVDMPSFRTLRRAGVAVSPGSIVTLGTLTIDVGGTSEVVTVTAEVPLVQAASGERSFTISTESVSNLPLANRTFESLLALAPGVAVTPGALDPAARIGGGGGSNYMIDGATAMDPGINRPAVRISVESLSEVKVVTSSYQAEYARSAGLQVNAVTKSGSNQFHGSLYEVARNSNWNSNRKTNILNGDAKPVEKKQDYGFSLGGPIGKPGGQNKLFFYFNAEFNPRTFGGDVNRYRVPTLPRAPGRFLAVARQQRESVPVHQGPAHRWNVRTDGYARLLPGWRCAGPHPREPAVSERDQHPEMVACTQRWGGAGPGLQLRKRRSNRASPWLSASPSRRLSTDRKAPGELQIH